MPPERGPRRPLHSIPLFLGFGLLAVLALRQVGNPDVGFHLKAGEYILSGQGWPRNDPFTYTLKDHPYIDTSWGYQVVVSAIQRGFDAGGLVLFHAILVLLIFFTLCRTARLEAVDAASLAGFLFLGGMASELRFEARPELVSLLFLALVLHLLHRRALALPSPIWTLPLIHLAWANCHSLFILGWAVMACFAIGAWFRDRRVDRALMGWSLASVAVGVINPYGLRGLLFPFTLATRMLANNPFARSIGEFASPFWPKIPDAYPFYPRLPILCFQILAVLALLSLPVLFRRRRWDLCLMTLAIFPVAAGMVRNMPLLVITAFPCLVWSFPAEGALQKIGLGGGLGRRLRQAGLAVLTVAILALGLRVFHDAYYIDSRRPCRFGLGWNRLILPLDAAEFATRAGLGGPVLNHLNFGGTLMWRLPQPIFIDGRLEVMGEKFYDEYRKIFEAEGALEEAVERYGIQWTIFPYDTNPELLARLSRNTRWRLAYVDDLAVIFVRESPDAAARVDPSLNARLGQDHRRPEIRTLPGLGGPARLREGRRWFSGLFQREEFPSEDFGLGLFHYFRGEPVRAERRFASAIQRSGGAYFEIYADLAASLDWQRRFEEARDCYRVVLEADPGNRIARKRLAER